MEMKQKEDGSDTAQMSTFFDTKKGVSTTVGTFGPGGLKITLLKHTLTFTRA